MKLAFDRASWRSWLQIESFSVPEVQTRLRASMGMCPSHAPIITAPRPNRSNARAVTGARADAASIGVERDSGALAASPTTAVAAVNALAAIAALAHVLDLSRLTASLIADASIPWGDACPRALIGVLGSGSARSRGPRTV